MAVQDQIAKPSLYKTSLGILLENILVIAVVWYQNLPPLSVIWIFWWQSVIIGWFNYRRMRALKQFSTKGLTMNGSPVGETEKDKKSVANFFLIHYGFFHFGYLIFMLVNGAVKTVAIHWLLITIIGFIWTHRSNYLSLVEADTRNKHNIGTMMFMPYLRVLPMHLAIIFSLGKAGVGFWIFMGLKTLADLGMHVLTHRWLAKDKQP